MPLEMPKLRISFANTSRAILEKIGSVFDVSEVWYSEVAMKLDNLVCINIYY